MEDGVKGNSVSPPESKVALKAGWLKKSTGLLGLWKDRYIQILRTQLLVCDSEDDQKCLETLELVNYERCQDHKAFLKRKRQFSLIPSPGTKVQEVKFQAKNAEERDEWIQNLNDGINRGKNKILDEVKIDTSCSLDHVTRDRVKVGAAKRRPPTRIHLKEVAEAADDDALRLGLEALDTGILTVVSPMPKPKESETKPQKEPAKMPMPPTKPIQLQTSETTNSDTESEDKASGAPSPPHKEPKKIPMPPTKPTSETTIPDTADSEDKAPGAPSPLQKEPKQIPMPPTKPSHLQTSEATLPDTTDSEDKAPDAPSPPHKEPIKIPMPPTKPIQTQALGITVLDTTDSKDQVPSAPSPPPKSLKENVYAREKLLSENELSNKDSVHMVINSESKENLSNVVNAPPKPPPKITSDKMKIKWVGSASDSDEKEDDLLEERGSKENLVDFESDEMEIPSSTHHKVLLDELKISELNKSNSIGNERRGKRLSKHLDKEKDDSQEVSTEVKNTENKEKDEQEVNDMQVTNAQNQATGQPVVHKSDEKKIPCLKYRKKSKNTRSQKDQIGYKPKASSMEDLLSPTSNEKDNDLPMSYLTKDHLQQVEMKLARGKERTKALLNQVLMGQLGNSAEGNGMEGNPETILNELMTQLQEASEVLQVIKEKGQKNDLNTSELVTEKQKQKELLAIQRRSVPF